MKNRISKKRIARARRHRRVRAHVSGNTVRPRLAVFVSSKHIYGQIIDDLKGHTLVSASDMKLAGAKKTGTKRVHAAAVGDMLAKAALKAGIKEVVFDRGGFQYHGRVKEFAEAARKAGLKF